MRGTMESITLPAIFARLLPSILLVAVTEVFDANVGFTPYAATDQPNHVANSSPQPTAIPASSFHFAGRLRNTTNR